MAEDKKEESKPTGVPIVDVINTAVKSEIVQDFRPFTRQVGRLLEFFGLLANAPFDQTSIRKKLVAGQLSSMASEHELLMKFQPLEDAIEAIPEDQRQIPPKRVFADVIDGVVLSEVDENEIRQMFANLLASTCNKETAASTHPLLSKIIAELTSDEAKILRILAQRKRLDGFSLYKPYPVNEEDEFFRQRFGQGALVCEFFFDISEDAGCSCVLNESLYFTNLRRLGVIQVMDETMFEYRFGKIERGSAYQEKQINRDSPLLKQILDMHSMQHILGTSYIRPIAIQLTEVGEQLCKTCIPEWWKAEYPYANLPQDPLLITSYAIDAASQQLKELEGAKKEINDLRRTVNNMRDGRGFRF